LWNGTSPIGQAQEVEAAVIARSCSKLSCSYGAFIFVSLGVRNHSRSFSCPFTKPCESVSGKSGDRNFILSERDHKTSIDPQQSAIVAAAVAAGKNITGMFATVNADDVPLIFLSPAQLAFAMAALSASLTLSIVPASGIMPCAQLLAS
jgi:hypothetical protein